MSNVIIDFSELEKHEKENSVVKVRIFGMVLNYSPIGRFIELRAVNVFSNDNKLIRLKLDEDLAQLSNPELAYSGTLVDAIGLYNGTEITLLSIRVIQDSALLLQSENIEVLKQISNIKKLGPN